MTIEAELLMLETLRESLEMNLKTIEFLRRELNANEETL